MIFDPTKPSAHERRPARLICDNVKGPYPLAWAITVPGEHREGVMLTNRDGKPAFGTPIVNIPPSAEEILREGLAEVRTDPTYGAVMDWSQAYRVLNLAITRALAAMEASK